MRTERLKGRVICLIVNETGDFFIGSSAARIAGLSGFHPMTLTRGAKIAEKNPKHTYKTVRYTIMVTDNFIKGLSRKGHFSYR